MASPVLTGSPTTEERIRSACARRGGAMLEVTDYAPLPLRKPVRSLVWIQGRLRDVPTDDVPGLLDLVATSDPNPALLQVNTERNSPAAGSDPDIRYALVRLEVESVVVADTTGAEAVTLGALLDARPDPFRTMESLGLDRCGVQRRVEDTDGDHDVRLPFATPVVDATGLNRAIRVLLGCPFRNGLRARGA